MGLPEENNPLFGEDESPTFSAGEKYFENERDPTRSTLTTDNGREMTLNYNSSYINGGQATKKPGDKNEFIDIINNEKELEKINNPWLKESYNLAKKFFDADSKLDSQDRAEMATIFNSIRNSQLMGMELTMLSVLTVPYFVIYRKYGGGGWRAFKQGGSNQAGRTALLNLNRKFPKLFIFSLFGMVVGCNVGGSIRYQTECDRLERAMVGNERKYNQYELLKMTVPLESLKWSQYYRVTSIDPSRRLRDPSEMLGGVLDSYKRTHGVLRNKVPDTGEVEDSNDNKSAEIPSFSGGVWQKNRFQHVDAEKSEAEEFQRTGVRTENGIPVSPYSKRFATKETPEDSNPAAYSEDSDSADLEDPFFQKQEEEKQKKRWW